MNGKELQKRLDNLNLGKEYKRTDHDYSPYCGVKFKKNSAESIKIIVGGHLPSGMSTLQVIHETIFLTIGENDNDLEWERFLKTIKEIINIEE